MNKWLHGNGHWCPACRGTGRGAELDRLEYEGGGFCQFYDPCTECKGTKRIAGDGPEMATPAMSCFSPTLEYGHEHAST